MYRKLRRIRIAVSAAYFVLLTLAVCDSAFGATRLGHLLASVQIVPAILAGAVMWLIVWILVTISFGRVYCSTVCPAGTLFRAGGRLSRLGKGKSKRYRYSPPADMVRITVASVVAACLFAGITVVVQVTDPFTIYRKAILAVTRPATVGIGAFAAGMVILLAIGAIGWYKGLTVCNTICPAGALLGLLGRQPVYRVDINTDLCIHCGKCEDVCAASCINLRDCTVDCSRCVMCLDCTAVCPNGAITVRRGRHQLSHPLLQSTAR